MYYQDPRQQMIEQEQASVLQLFRIAMPQISEKAQIIYVEHNPYYLPSGTRVDLKECFVEFPDKLSGKTLEYRFTIGHHVIEFPARQEFVFVLLSEVAGHKAFATVKYKDSENSPLLSVVTDL